MRPLLLFLALLLAFFAILKFYPSSESTGVAAGDTERTGSAGFLERPGGGAPAKATPLERRTEPATTLTRDKPPASQSKPAPKADWIGEFEGVARAGAEEVELAGLMVRDRCDGLDRAIKRLGDRLTEDRGRLIHSFGLAYRGEFQRAGEIARGIKGQLPETEERLLRSMLEGTRPPSRPSQAASFGPMALAMAMLANERLVEEDITQKAWPQAASGLSELLLAELDAPWAPSRERIVAWAQRLDEVQNRHRWNPRGVWPHVEMVVEGGDSVSTICARYRRENPGAAISPGLVRLANNLEGDLIHPGDTLRVPTEPLSVDVSIALRMVFVLLGDEVAAAYECTVGAEGMETPTGEFTAGLFEVDPMYWGTNPPLPFGHPDNPMGTRWIRWDNADRSPNNLSIGFHGTADPETVGYAASKGCIRLHNRDVEELYDLLPKWAPIYVQ